ncbi:MAG: hypothetical protein ACJ0RL_06930 [Porticoccaceae bacterium]
MSPNDLEVQTNVACGSERAVPQAKVSKKSSSDGYERYRAPGKSANPFQLMAPSPERPEIETKSNIPGHL